MRMQHRSAMPRPCGIGGALGAVPPRARAVFLGVLLGLPGLTAPPALACDQNCQERIDKLAGEAKARDQSVARGRNNAVVVAYGAGIPVLKCRPLHFCTIQLQPGEILREDLALGNTVLWTAEWRVSGGDDTPLVRILVKPDTAATETSLIVSTNRRFYDIQLVKSDTDYTPLLAFTYPADVAAANRARLAEIEARRDAARQAEQVAVAVEEARQSLQVGQRQVFSGDLDFRFNITGKAPFKPVRVFSDGRKTWIDLPERYRGERPVFLAGVSGAGPGAKSGEVVNSRWRGNRLEIDRVITQGQLVIGVGRKARAITIRKATR